MEKIILIKGNAHTPSRFWQRMVCEKREFSSEHKKEGWIETDNRQFLTDKQIAYLDQPVRGA